MGVCGRGGVRWDWGGTDRTASGPRDGAAPRQFVWEGNYGSQWRSSVSEQENRRDKFSYVSSSAGGGAGGAISLA